MSDNDMKPISDQNEAMHDYLDDLLSTMDGHVDNNVCKIKLVHSNQSIPDKIVTEQQPLRDETTEQKIMPDVNKVKPVIKAKNQPTWVSDELEVLICVVNNVKLAIPMSAIAEQIDFNANLKHVENQPSWVLGLNIEGNSFVAVVDTANLLLQLPLRDVRKQGYEKVILLAGSRWGLAVDGCLTQCTLKSVDVKWRQDSEVRPWLCGTELSQQLAIVNPNSIFINFSGGK